jgi:hypothetical protein
LIFIFILFLALGSAFYFRNELINLINNKENTEQIDPNEETNTEQIEINEETDIEVETTEETNTETIDIIDNENNDNEILENTNNPIDEVTPLSQEKIDELIKNKIIEIYSR